MDGQLRIQIVNALGEPVPDAKIVISFTGDPNQTVEEMTTDASGNTQILTLDTPPLEYSMEPSEMQPYSQYTMEVTAEGYQPINVSGIEVFQGQVSVQRTVLSQEDALRETPDNIVIPANTLYGNYPEKIPEAEIKPITETGEIVLSRVVIPEFIIVHDGAPTDTTAKNYYVRYRDYIKNVASSEIYATWPDAAIRANVLAILSFTMNRVYTEW
ncbi:MAG: carboxypeptidase-like regulatory domain-containing protein [Agathobacter sp.]|nr:carboxypeptidase-like regulatory domain-containing protein [Agathobacter sp.]